MKTIVVSGAHSNIGKTSLVEKILSRLPNYSALKVTVKRDLDCPRHSNCRVCSGLKGDFQIVSDEKTIDTSGTDTARMKKAGAKKVVWLKATLKGLKEGLERAFRELRDSEGLIIEGTSVLRHVKPDLTVYIKDKGSRLKKGAKEAEKRADIIIDVNRPY